MAIGARQKHEHEVTTMKTKKNGRFRLFGGGSTRNLSAEPPTEDAAPVLLAVRKRSSSDSGYDDTSVTGSPSPVQRNRNSAAGRFFAGLFHRSSSLLLNPAVHDHHDHRRHTYAKSQSSSAFHKYFRSRTDDAPPVRRALPVVPPVVPPSSASSSSTCSVLPLRETDDSSSSPDHSKSGPAAHHSSSNSVISASDYDSGAFSRTSSPSEFPLLPKAPHHLSAKTLPISAPLSAPSLVLAVQKHIHPDDYEDDVDSVDANLVLSCLNAAAESSTIRTQIEQGCSTYPDRRARDTSDVSVTIGMNTKLTIAPTTTNLRRSRSGLPVLGTAGLAPTRRTSSPSKTLSRTRISTVYLNPSSRPASPARVNRSGSTVIRCNAASSSPKTASRCVREQCTQRVTVNGQHFCSVHDLVASFVDASDGETQPNSLINI